MKNKRQINGRRFVFALAAAELELRKREGWQHRATSGCLEKLVDIGYGLQEENTQMWRHRAKGNLTRHWEAFRLADVWNAAQAIKNYNQALDFAMCFVLRHPGQLQFVAQATVNDNLGSKFRLAQYRKSKEYERWKQEQEEDAADEDFEQWLESQRKWEPSPEQKARKEDALLAQIALQECAVQRAETPDEAFDLLTRICAEQGYKLVRLAPDAPYGRIKITETEWSPGGEEQSKSRSNREVSDETQA